MIKPYQGIMPVIAESAFIEDSAQIIGDVVIKEDSSVWFNTVVRGDVNYIRIGSKTNIQDGSVLHVTHDTCPLVIDDEVTVAHGVILHGCRINSRCLIGMGAIVMDNAEIEENSIVAAGSVVTENTKIPAGWLALGIPAKPKRKLVAKEFDWIKQSAENYIKYKTNYTNPNII